MKTEELIQILSNFPGVDVEIEIDAFHREDFRKNDHLEYRTDYEGKLLALVITPLDWK